MRKFIVLMLLIFVLTGCWNNTSSEESNELESKISGLQKEITALEEQKATLESEIVEKKEENGTAKYVITFRVKQSHFSFDLSDHLKDSMNQMTFEIPVDKEYYDSVDVGDVLSDDFRVGSLVMKGSFGNWTVTVDQKEIM